MLIAARKPEKFVVPLMVIFLLTIPWTINASTWGTVAFSLGILVVEFRKIAQNKIHFFLMAYFVYLSVSYALYFDSGSRYDFFITNLPFLCFPAIIGAMNVDTGKFNRSFFLLIFAGSVTVAITTMLLLALYRFRGNEFYLVVNGYEPITFLIGMHPSYLALFVAFSFFIVFDHLLSNYQRLTVSKKLLFGFWLVFLAFAVFYIRSRLMILSFIILIIFAIFYALPPRYRLRSAFFLCVFLAAGYFAILLTDFHIGRFEITQVHHGIRLKEAQWRASVEIIKSNLLFGVTASRSQDELNMQYAAMNFDEGVNLRYNSHNQFLTSLVEGGVIGFLLLFVPLFIVFYEGIRRNDLVIITFFILTLLAFSTESMLVRQKGMIYYAFFVSFLAGVKQERDPGLQPQCVNKLV